MLNISLTKKCLTFMTASILVSSGTFIAPRITPVEEPMKGAIISSKIDNIDWETLSKENNFVLLHAGSGLKDDEKFEEYYEKSRENGLDVGVIISNELSSYYRNSPSDITLYAERRYSHVKIGQLMDKKISYPVYLRIDYGDTPIEEALPKEHVNSLMNRYELIMKHNKFIPGIYGSKEIVEYFRNNIDNFDERFVNIVAEEDKIITTPVEQLSADVSQEEIVEVKEEKPIKATDLSDKIEYIYTDKNYNDTSRRIIPGILLSMDLLAFLGIKVIEKKQKQAIK